MTTTHFLQRCLNALTEAHLALEKEDTSSVKYDIYRAASVKEFELILEQVGKLLRKAIKPYFAVSREVDKLTFKEVFRVALKHDLLTIEEVERWFGYRDNRNASAHEYGQEYAEDVLQQLPAFIADTTSLITVLNARFDADS